jgi:hypothetical protein
MKRIILLACLVVAVLAVGCTQNQRARQFGGTANEVLPPGRKLVIATWKQDNLWILTRPMKSNEVAEVYEFTESSSFGLVEGKVVIKEQK